MTSPSPAPLTDPEAAVVAVLEGESACSWHHGCDVEDCYGPRAKAIVAKLGPLMAAKFYENLAELTDKQGPMSANGFRALAALTRHPLSLPASKETPNAE